MSAIEAFEICEHRWADEVEYADTLRDRRKLWTTLIVVAVGLGVFRIDKYVDPDHVLIIGNMAVRVFMKMCTTLAVGFFAFGAFFLFNSGHKGDNAPKRASELLELTDAEVDELSWQDGHASTCLKTEKLRTATDVLATANRRVSKKLKIAGILIGLGYAFLTINAMLYSLWQ